MDKLQVRVANLLEQQDLLNLKQNIDWEKFNHYAIVHHSTSIEGASLSVHETMALLGEGLTAKGKPLVHHLMQTDHYKALLFTLDAAHKKKTLTPELLKQMAATRFVDFTKVPDLIRLFCDELNQFMQQNHDKMECLQISFDAHFNFVSMHPLADGNGRVSRLIMNYIQHYYQLPLGIVFTEDKSAYYKALTDSRNNEDIGIFRQFMYKQYEKLLLLEIRKAAKSKTAKMKSGDSGETSGLSMIF